MWMLNPKFMCRQHLIGEHGEIHKAIGNLRRSGRWAKNLIAKGYLEPQNFRKRHDELEEEMLRRGYKHFSPLTKYKFSESLYGKIDRKKALKDITERCEECRKNFKEVYG